MKHRSAALVVAAVVGWAGIFAATAGASTPNESHILGTSPYVVFETVSHPSGQKFTACGYTTAEAAEAVAHKTDPTALGKLVQRYEKSVCFVTRFPSSTNLGPLGNRVNACLGKHDKGAGVSRAMAKECVEHSEA